MKPEEVTQHVSDVMQGVGDPIKQGAAIRAEEARLSQRSAQASRIADANPGNAQAQIDQDNAFKDVTDFHNGPLAKLKNNWHGAGMAMQGELPVDLSTYNGLREQWLRNEGSAPPPAMEPRLRRAATQAKNAIAAEEAAKADFGKAVEKVPKTKRTADDVANDIREKMGLGPCLVA